LNEPFFPDEAAFKKSFDNNFNQKPLPLLSTKSMVAKSEAASMDGMDDQVSKTSCYKKEYLLLSADQTNHLLM
jgi:hypothetical protein